ncbi:MAG: hypothetical protein ACI8VC_002846 [Candidatus Endobugula sp.]|jgi:hypothetical protein
MEKEDYSDRRVSDRVKTNTLAPVYVEQDGVVTHAVCNDLSASGILLTVDKEFPIGSELLVTLSSETSKVGELIARCTVVRLQLAPQKKYFLGLEIQTIIDDKGNVINSRRKNRLIE